MATACPVSTVSFPVMRTRGTIAQRSRMIQPSKIREYIKVALAHTDHTELLPLPSSSDAQIILDEMWKVSTRFHVEHFILFTHVFTFFRYWTHRCCLVLLVISYGDCHSKWRLNMTDSLSYLSSMAFSAQIGSNIGRAGLRTSSAGLIADPKLV